MLSRQENIIVNMRTTTGKIGRDAIMELSKDFVGEKVEDYSEDRVIVDDEGNQVSVTKA